MLFLGCQVMLECKGTMKVGTIHLLTWIGSERYLFRNKEDFTLRAAISFLESVIVVRVPLRHL